MTQLVPLDFQWTPQPQAEAWVNHAVEHALAAAPEARGLAERLRDQAGVRFVDLIDTIFLGDAPQRVASARHVGWTRQADDHDWEMYRNDQGIFPTIAVGRNLSADRIAINLKVESVEDFLRANGLKREIVGGPRARWVWSGLWPAGVTALIGVVQRLGWPNLWTNATVDPVAVALALDSFRSRLRSFASDEDGFGHAGSLMARAIELIGRDVACQVFFKAEREYWQSRNRAAQVQKARQDEVGIGWANHDHHTYRSSRRHFTRLIAMWEKLGFHCRERFYAGKEAGWGAQVMEQPNAGIVTFNDVDLSPEELTADFAHEPLPPRDSRGTVGLWCALHGESFLQAGMHHLECQFDFDALKEQLESREGVKVMKPFTDLPYLKQAFTEGERWPVDPKRIERLLAEKLITPQQAEQFQTHGAIGSHLENLQRNAGFKGFNQRGVSEIISATDPRRHLSVNA